MSKRQDKHKYQCQKGHVESQPIRVTSMTCPACDKVTPDNQNIMLPMEET